MNKQKEKVILDVCCGKRMFWFNKQHLNTIFQDNRLEVNPDIIGDFRKLEFKDNSFKLVVFDPPHLIGGNHKESETVKSYGDLNKDTWRKDLKKGFDECWRVLEDYGILIFKWSDCNRWSNKTYNCNVRVLLDLLEKDPLFGHKTRANKNMISSTYWFCFMKIPKIVLEEKK